MDFKPRKLPVFNRVERKAATAPMTADRKAVCQWNGAEAKKGNAIVCEGLGYEGKAAEIRKGDALTFSFGNLKTDSVEWISGYFPTIRCRTISCVSRFLWMVPSLK